MSKLDSSALYGLFENTSQTSEETPEQTPVKDKVEEKKAPVKTVKREAKKSPAKKESAKEEPVKKEVTKSTSKSIPKKASKVEEVNGEPKKRGRKPSEKSGTQKNYTFKANINDLPKWKVYSALTGRTVGEIINDAVNEYIERHPAE